MPWLQLRLDTDPDGVEALEDRMLATGAAAVTLQDNADQPVLEPGVGETPLWGQTRITGLYRADTDMDAVLEAFPKQALAHGNHRIEILEDKDWEREWMQHYAPMHFGERLWVVPSWLEPPEPDAPTLLLDPGLAFGTGTHPTTALCLEQIALTELEGVNVVDYGCGSGILAVAALLLGARQALAVDNDPQALVACALNAERNGIAPERVDVQPPDGVADRHRPFGPLVIANILAGPLMSLSDELLALIEPGGELMLAGLLDTQAEALIDHYTPHITLHAVAERDGWVCLRGRR